MVMYPRPSPPTTAGETIPPVRDLALQASDTIDLHEFWERLPAAAAYYGYAYTPAQQYFLKMAEAAEIVADELGACEQEGREPPAWMQAEIGDHNVDHHQDDLLAWIGKLADSIVAREDRRG